jgi:hypothetical protein
MAVAKKEVTIITEVITKVDKTEVVAVMVATTVVDPTTTMVAIKVAINKTRRIQLTESQW